MTIKGKILRYWFSPNSGKLLPQRFVFNKIDMLKNKKKKFTKEKWAVHASKKKNDDWIV